jgi:hypothetical protein
MFGWVLVLVRLWEKLRMLDRATKEKGLMTRNLSDEEMAGQR